MECLFYDLEMATQLNGAKICEFGYVITDENFNILEKNNFIINPNIYRYEWDKRVVKNILTRKVIQYEMSETFDYYYDTIKDIIEEVDYIFGHTLDSDARALNDELIRYNYPAINYTFYDVKEFYKAYSEKTRDVGLNDILLALNISGNETIHDAMSDAYNTMLVLQKLCANLNISVEGIIEKYPNAKDKTENFIVESGELKKLQREEEFIKYFNGDETNLLTSTSFNNIRFNQFVDNVKPQTGGNDIFKNKRIAFSTNYEEDHYSQMLNIVQMIKNEGGEYTNKIHGADIYVSYNKYDENGDLIICEKDKIVSETKSYRSICVIDFYDFLNMLNITEEYLDSLPRVSFDFLYDDSTIIKSNIDRATIDRIKTKQNINTVEKKRTVIESSNSTIGERYGEFLKSFLKTTK